MDEPKYSSEYDGRPRWLWAKKCSQCGKVFWLPKNQLDKRKTCSKECRGKSMRQRVTVFCVWCGESIDRALSKVKKPKSGLQFCSQTCKNEAQRLEGLTIFHPEHYGRAKYNKEKLIRIRGLRCERCSNTEWLGEPIPLEAHHIDGNRDNNLEANIQLLCRNCHGLTDTFRGRNHKCKGAGSRTKSVTVSL
jgi:hypothetical protein